MGNEIPFIDTNIFLRFLVVDRAKPSLNRRAKSIIQKIQSKKLKVQTTPLIVSETVYVLESYYGLSKKEVVEKLEPLIGLEHIHLNEKTLILAAFTPYVENNVDFEDAYTYMAMQEKEVNAIYTFDTKHFKRFKNITIIK